MHFSKSSLPAYCTWAVVALALMLGGGGVNFPMPELAVQGGIIVAGAVWLMAADSARLGAIPKTVWAIALLIILLPLLQLLPLPAGLWHALPGRQVEWDSLALVGAGQAAMPLTMVPHMTLVWLVSAACAVVVMVMVASLSDDEARGLLAVVALCGGGALMAGAGQIMGGQGAGARFYYPDQPFLVGFQGNHNAAADMLLVAMVAAVAWGCAARSPMAQPYGVALLAGVVALFSVGVVLTASRTGIALLLVAYGGVAVLMARVLAGHKRGALIVLAVGGGVLMLAAGALLASQNAAMASALHRFADSDEPRPAVWANVWYCIQIYFPFGSGLGSFKPIYAAQEPLAAVHDRMMNHAHNEYLEVALEAGIAGVVAVCAVLGLLVRSAILALRHAVGASRAIGIFAVTGCCVFILHSIDDYPLRTMAMASMAASCAGLLLRCSTDGAGLSKVEEQR